jgi:hypothetical protein
MRPWKIPAIAAAIGCLIVAPALGAIATMNPVADTFVSSANPSGNFGGAGALEVSAPNLPKGEFQSLMKFDTSAAKSSFDAAFGVGQWQVQSVTLQLTSANPLNPIFNTNAAGQFAASWMQNDSWAEGTGMPNSPTSDGVTFSTLSSFLSGADQSLGTFNFPGGTSGNNTYTLALAPGFVSDIAAGGNVSMRMLAADSAMSYCLNSRNFGTASVRPLLTINAIAVPEPATVLFGFMPIAIALRQRRGK